MEKSVSNGCVPVESNSTTSPAQEPLSASLLRSEIGSRQKPEHPARSMQNSPQKESLLSNLTSSKLGLLHVATKLMRPLEKFSTTDLDTAMMRYLVSGVLRLLTLLLPLLM